MSKKLLFLTHVGAAGGAEYKMLDLCESTTYSSKVVYFQNGPLEKNLKDKNISSSVLPMPKNMTSFTKDDALLGLIKAIPATLSMVLKLSKEIKQHDITVCISQKSFILASLAKPLTRKPIIWFMNDILSDKYFSKTLISILKIISRLSANHIVLNSATSLKEWKNSGASTKNVSIIYPGINIDNFSKEIKNQTTIQNYKNQFSQNSKPLIGIFGRISSWKGQDVFLKAIAQIENVNAIIVGDAIFGEDDYKNSLIELTKSLKIENRVTFTGHINDIACVMAACDIVTHCSTLPEPFGQVIAQATTVQTPVIATDAGGAKEIIEHDITGQLTPMGDVDALVLAIKRYLDNPKWAKQLTIKAKEHTDKNFSKASMINKFEALIKK